MTPIIDAAQGVFRGILKPILDKWIPDANERLAAENLIFNASHAVTMAQLEVNRTEALSSNVFVSGWRPACGWVCVGSLFYAVIGYSLFNWIIALTGAFNGHPVPALPAPDATITFELLMGLLGLGGYRTYEKVKGLTQ